MAKKIKIITHSGSYHADDILAVATLGHIHGGLDKIEIIRSRDPEIISGGDYVVDVGGVYDSKTKRFDHHQPEGAGSRENGIPYASFGLVWKEFGEKICGSEKIADTIDRKLAAPIDAEDNGVAIAKFVLPGVATYRFQEFMHSFEPTWKEKDVSIDDIFSMLVKIGYELIEREIKMARHEIEAESLVLKAYEDSEDKRIIVLDLDYPWGKALSLKPEPIYVVYPKREIWHVKAVRNNPATFENRKSLPAEWAGKRNEEFALISNVPDAIFCHVKLFTCTSKSRAGAIALAKKALESGE